MLRADERGLLVGHPEEARVEVVRLVQRCADRYMARVVQMRRGHPGREQFGPVEAPGGDHPVAQVGPEGRRVGGTRRPARERDDGDWEARPACLR